jgi:hypothetical protein
MTARLRPHIGADDRQPLETAKQRQKFLLDRPPGSRVPVPGARCMRFAPWRRIVIGPATAAPSDVDPASTSTSPRKDTVARTLTGLEGLAESARVGSADPSRGSAPSHGHYRRLSSALRVSTGAAADIQEAEERKSLYRSSPCGSWIEFPPSTTIDWPVR